MVACPPWLACGDTGGGELRGADDGLKGDDGVGIDEGVDDGGWCVETGALISKTESSLWPPFVPNGHSGVAKADSGGVGFQSVTDGYGTLKFEAWTTRSRSRLK